MKITTAREGFLAFQQFARGCNPRSIYVYDGHLRRFERFVGPVSFDCAGARVMDYLQRSGELSDNTRRQVFAILRALFRWGYDYGHVRANPFRGMKLPRVRKVRRVFLARPQTYELLAEPGDEDGPRASRDSAIMAMFYFAGLRLNEALGMKVADLDLPRGDMLVLGKGGTAIRVTITAKLRPYLMRWLRQHPGGPWLFPGQGTARPLTGAAVEDRLRLYGPRAGIAERVTPHALRRTAANELWNRGTPVRAVRDFLRHRHLMTTEVYLNIQPGEAGRHMGKL